MDIPPGSAYATLETSAPLQDLAGLAPGTSIPTFGPCMQTGAPSPPAFLLGMLQFSLPGKHHFYHRTNAEFSYKEFGDQQIESAFVLESMHPSKMDHVLWQLPYPAQGWACCPNQVQREKAETPYSVREVETEASIYLRRLHDEDSAHGSPMFSAAFGSMASGGSSELVRAAGLIKRVVDKLKSGLHRVLCARSYVSYLHSHGCHICIHPWQVCIRGGS